MQNLEHLEARLQGEAKAFTARRTSPRRYIVFDIEYVYDRVGQERADRHAGEQQAVNDNAGDAFKVRWPFHRVGCIVALAIAVLPSGTVEVEALKTWSRPEMTEAALVQAFSAFVAARPGAMPVTWGGECKDLPSLLAIAMREGIALPPSVGDPHWKHGRIDLCTLLCGKAKNVHLNEYAHAQGLPAKLMTKRELGKVAERGRWSAVRQHCEVDVTIEAMVLVRWLLATGQLKGTRAAVDAAIVDRVSQLRPYRPELLQAIAGFGSVGLDRAA
ncbi:hypothetical protein GRI40_05855 [Altererythrobacter aerius]|uniref:Predicted 3'-5' exonuclease PolB-like domain-containing protein n=1 Tax=Tsuneonella aeria TaxID=1837929 RepID=A0A6I4TD87_9SPHN|nr:hypothetical protein [Tsuneonella aeria]MXO74744.1 hypothetical protein [Tsuneonella aeria]